MSAFDLLPALEPVISAFTSLGIEYYIGGSIASSTYGIPRTTMDIDIIAAFDREHTHAFFEILKDTYYVDKDIITKAIQRNSSFNIIHLDSMMKLDIFILKNRTFDKEAFKRKKMDSFGMEENSSAQYYFSSPEDIILSKLEWYRMGGQVSERQWKDIIGVMRVQDEKLDMGYLKKWAKELKVEELLQKALYEAGMTNE